jgi:hypothetical protein
MRLNYEANRELGRETKDGKGRKDISYYSHDKMQSNISTRLNLTQK